VLLQVRARPVTPPIVPGSGTGAADGLFGYLIVDGFTAIFTGFVLAIIFKSFRKLEWEVPELFLNFSVVFAFVNFFLAPSLFPEIMIVGTWLDNHWIIGTLGFLVTFFLLGRLSSVIDDLYHS